MKSKKKKLFSLVFISTHGPTKCFQLFTYYYLGYHLLPINKGDRAFIGIKVGKSMVVLQFLFYHKVFYK